MWTNDHLIEISHLNSGQKLLFKTREECKGGTPVLLGPWGHTSQWHIAGFAPFTTALLLSHPSCGSGESRCGTGHSGCASDGCSLCRCVKCMSLGVICRKTGSWVILAGPTNPLLACNSWAEYSENATSWDKEEEFNTAWTIFASLLEEDLLQHFSPAIQLAPRV